MHFETDKIIVFTLNAGLTGESMMNLIRLCLFEKKMKMKTAIKMQQIKNRIRR